MEPQTIESAELGSPSAVEIRKARGGRGWWLFAVLVLLVGATDAVGHRLALLERNDLALPAFLGFLFAQVGVLVAWAFLGMQRPLVRFPAAAGGLTGIAACMFIGHALPSEDYVVLSTLTAQALVQYLFLWALRRRGCVLASVRQH